LTVFTFRTSERRDHQKRFISAPWAALDASLSETDTYFDISRVEDEQKITALFGAPAGRRGEVKKMGLPRPHSCPNARDGSNEVGWVYIGWQPGTQNGNSG
jgi:hypothetical protein